MNIPESIKKFKDFVGQDFFILALFLLSTTISFSLGYLAAKDEYKEEVRIDTSAMVSATTEEGERVYVASVTGTKYHFPWCSGAQRIKEENQIWFSSKEDAELAGYEPATNCPGL